MKAVPKVWEKIVAGLPRLEHCASIKLIDIVEGPMRKFVEDLLLSCRVPPATKMRPGLSRDSPAEKLFIA